MPPPPGRAEALTQVRRALEEARSVVLTTHVNADGDGAGSEIAMARWLSGSDVAVTLVNPTPFPDAFSFLLDELPASTPNEEAGRDALAAADLILVLDTSERDRLGAVAEALGQTRVAVIDHHPDSPDSVGEVVARDPTACATGELVYDLLHGADAEITPAIARALYVALVTDTGSFRFGNTTARAHELTGDLLRSGVDVEAMFRRIFARYTPEGLALLQRALASLEVGEMGRLSWITVRTEDLEQTGATAEDREGLVEYARRLQGVEVAILFREIHGGRTKASLRSNGDVNVAAVAREFGGGGHRQAAGVLLERPVEEARREVVARLRRAVRAGS